MKQKQSDAFNLWKGNNKLNNQIEMAKKSTNLGHLSSITDKKCKLISLRLGFNALKDDHLNNKIHKRILIGLFRTTSGRIFNAFNKWKEFVNLRNDTDKAKFSSGIERKLETIIKNRKKYAFDKIKEIYLDCQEAKRRCLREIISKTVSKIKVYFINWAKIAEHEEHIEACRTAINLFAAINDSLKDNVSLIFNPDRKTEKKKEAVRYKLYKYNYEIVLFKF